MRISAVVPPWIWLGIFLLQLVTAQLNPNHVSINEKRKHIEADSSWLDKRQQEVQRVALDASNKEKVILDLLNTQQRFQASASGNVAAAETYDGKRAQVQKIGDKGGIATVDGHKAQLRTKEDESGRHAFLKADGKYDLDTVAAGDFKDPAKTSFAATNDRFDFNLNPKTHDNHTGTGTLAFNDKVAYPLSIPAFYDYAPREV
ncbi:hypothetical protein OESDEN_08759 [Oesophagostomum dentatum]|uniref:Uncharacterized protein n=1 Tax=Oesophagostomum dentatum TaxID=61180 RepID=A0A0B1T297_OESDE|nr:hypothetical protein OESDEN_08759 [Oesophagostomum dentatum]